MKKEKTLKLNLSSVLAMITILLTFFISAVIAKQMTSANAASDTDWNTTTTSWTQEYEYTTVPHSYTVPYSYTESDTTHTRWETETEHETATETSQTVPVMTPTEPDVETTNPYYTYEVYSGKVTITGANPAMGSSITIPSTLGGYPVTEIGWCAFSGCTNLKRIKFPDSITSIDVGAFNGCMSLESILVDSNNKNYSSDEYGVLFNKDKTELIQYPVGNTRTSYTIPDSVTSIDGYAFLDCTNLASITIPDSVTSIGYRAFWNCTNLASITVDVNSKNYSSDEYGVLFNKDKTELIQYPIGNKRTSYTIPNSVTSIGDVAFYYCTSLKSITIPDSVTSIGDEAFSDCTSLTSITIPDGVTSISGSAFSGCTKLASITIPNGVTSIGYCAFYNCESLESITIPDSVTSIGDGAFSGCTSLSSITIPDDVTSIGDHAFKNTAYYNNESNWENGVLYIGNHLIEAKDTVSGSYVIKEGTKTIAVRAFDVCTSLSSITIPDSVTSIGEYAFYNCTSLESVTFGENSQLTSIGDGAFSLCTKLASITIPDSVTSIGYGAFSNCTSLSSVIFGENSRLTSIGGYAFEWCTSLASITIPDSVTSIGYCAFYNCTSLESITVDSNNKNYSSDEYGVLFNKDKTELIQYPIGNSRTSYAVPNSVTSIGGYAFFGCTSLASITIPDSVTSIGSNAFYGCTSLEDIYYSGTDEEWNEIISDGIPNIKIHFGNEAPTEPTSKPTKPAVRLEINSPSTKSINYGDSIVLHADIEWTHPDGAKMIKVVWSVDNGNFSYSVSPDGLSCTISPESSGETVFTATVYDMDGNEISSDTVQMTAKASIWHKIIAFFKKLLSLNEIIPYAMKNLYKK